MILIYLYGVLIGVVGLLAGQYAALSLGIRYVKKHPEKVTQIMVYLRNKKKLCRPFP